MWHLNIWIFSLWKIARQIQTETLQKYNHLREHKPAIPDSDTGGRRCIVFLNTVVMKRTGRPQQADMLWPT